MWIAIAVAVLLALLSGLSLPSAAGWGLLVWLWFNPVKRWLAKRSPGQRMTDFINAVLQVDLVKVGSGIVMVGLFAFLVAWALPYLVPTSIGGKAVGDYLNDLRSQTCSTSPLVSRCRFSKSVGEIGATLLGHKVYITQIRLVGFGEEATSVEPLVRTLLRQALEQRQQIRNQFKVADNQEFNLTIKGLPQAALADFQRPLDVFRDNELPGPKVAFEFGLDQESDLDLLQQVDFSLGPLSFSLSPNAIIRWFKSRHSSAVQAKLIVVRVDNNLSATLVRGEQYWHLGLGDLPSLVTKTPYPNSDSQLQPSEDDSNATKEDVDNPSLATLLRGVVFNYENYEGQTQLQYQQPEDFAALYLYQIAWEGYTLLKQGKLPHLEGNSNPLNTIVDQAERATRYLLGASTLHLSDSKNTGLFAGAEKQRKLLLYSSYFAMALEGGVPSSHKRECTELGRPPSIPEGYLDYWTKRIGYYQQLKQTYEGFAKQLKDILPSYGILLMLRLGEAQLCAGNYSAAVLAFKGAAVYHKIANSQTNSLRAFIAERTGVAALFDGLKNNPDTFFQEAVQHDPTYLPSYFRRLELLLCRPTHPGQFLDGSIHPCSKIDPKVIERSDQPIPTTPLLLADAWLNEIATLRTGNNGGRHEIMEIKDHLILTAPFRIFLFEHVLDGSPDAAKTPLYKCLKDKALAALKVFWPWIAAQPELFTTTDEYKDTIKRLGELSEKLTEKAYVHELNYDSKISSPTDLIKPEELAQSCGT